MSNLTETMAEVKRSTSLKAYAEDHLQKRRGKFVCPLCNSGGHATAESDSAFSIMPGDKKWTCFSCRKSGDVFDLAAVVESIDKADKRAQLQAVAKWAHIPIEARNDKRAARPLAAKPVGKKPEPAPDYAEGRDRHRAFILEAQSHVEEAAGYLETRGLTVAEARKLGLGYDSKTHSLVIPYPGSDFYYIRRFTWKDGKGKYKKPPTEEVGQEPVFNPAALDEPAFFVVEGQLDACAVMLEGFPAVALGSTGSGALIRALDAKPSKPVAIVIPDADDKGAKGYERLAQQFEERHIPYRPAPIEREGCKDADQWRKEDPDGLKAFLSRHYAETVQRIEEEREEAYNEALGRLRVLSPADVAASLYMLEDAAEPTPCSIPSLDAALGGGLPRGLVILGAVSSLGKTTLCVQMADEIARSGRPVLFLTMEQSAGELVAKSLSRYMAALPDGDRLAASASEMANPKRRAKWGQPLNAQMLKACQAYSDEVAPKLKIMEAENQPSVEDLAAVCRRMADHDGVPPVVFIDYLQLLKAENERDTDKQTTDKNVTALRRLARDLKTTVVCISSLNRSSYSGSISLESFKESGAIEYGADVLLGLQPVEMDTISETASDKAQKAKANEIMKRHKGEAARQCELVILKQRNGGTPAEGLPLEFDAVHATFHEVGGTRKAERV